MKRKIRKKPSGSRAPFWIVLIILVIIALAGWRTYYCVYKITPQFLSLTILKDGQPLKLINGETVTLHPEERIKIQEISTNICFNYGVRLFSRDLDLNAFLYEEILIADMLQDKLRRETFSVEIKHYNERIGQIELIVEPYVEDWLDKADRTIDKKRKIEILEKALKAAPEDKRIKERLILEYRTNKMWPSLASFLEKEFNEALDQQILYDLLEIYETTSDSNKVISTLRRLLALNPEDNEMRLRLATILENKGKIKEAIVEYEEILKGVSGKEALSLYKTLGFLYSKRGDSKRAISNYLKAVELDKNDVNLYYNISHLYEKIGQRDKSDDYLSKAVELQSGDMESRMKLAESLIDKKKFTEAEKHLKKVLAEDPKSMKALLFMLKIAEEGKDKKNQIKYYQKILAIEPGNQTVIFNLGVLEYEMGNLERAVPYFEKVRKADPKDKEIHIFLFDIYRKQKKDDLAYKEVLSLIDLGVKEKSYYDFIFEYLNKKNDYKRMIEILKKGIEQFPEEKTLREYLIIAYLNTDEEDLAITQMKEILKKSPDDVSLLLRLAILQEKQGNLKEALASYKKIIDISPGNAEAEEAYFRLRLEVLPDEAEQ